jgi:hypothetical protein
MLLIRFVTSTAWDHEVSMSRDGDTPPKPECATLYAAMRNDTVNLSPCTIGVLGVWKGRQRGAS